MMKLTAYQMYTLFVRGSSSYYRCIARLASMIPWTLEDQKKEELSALLYHFVAESDEARFGMAYSRFMADVQDRHGCGYENLMEAFMAMEAKGYVWPEEA